MKTREFWLIFSVEFEKHLYITDNGCWYWLKRKGIDNTRYSIYKGEPVHRLVWELFNERPIPEGMVIMHSCDNKSCCNPDHLKLGTQAESRREAVARVKGALQIQQSYFLKSPLFPKHKRPDWLPQRS